jgi:hypothetical protein
MDRAWHLTGRTFDKQRGAMASMVNGLRHGVRGLRRSPGFAVTAVLTLALGIGATTAIFTLVYDVMLRPLPYPHAERVVVMRETVAEFRDTYPTLPMNANNFVMWQKNSRSFEAMAVMSEGSMPLGAGDHALGGECEANDNAAGGINFLTLRRDESSILYTTELSPIR